jgi:hypothetical protein
MTGGITRSWQNLVSQPRPDQLSPSTPAFAGFRTLPAGNLFVAEIFLVNRLFRRISRNLGYLLEFYPIPVSYQTYDCRNATKGSLAATQGARQIFSLRFAIRQSFKLFLR